MSMSVRRTNGRTTIRHLICTSSTCPKVPFSSSILMRGYFDAVRPAFNPVLLGQWIAAHATSGRVSAHRFTDTNGRNLFFVQRGTPADMLPERPFQRQRTFRTLPLVAARFNAEQRAQGRHYSTCRRRGRRAGVHPGALYPDAGGNARAGSR
jgi:hypothetical protein